MKLTNGILAAIATAAACIIVVVGTATIAESPLQNDRSNDSVHTAATQSSGGSGMVGSDSLKPPKIVLFKRPTGPLPNWMTDAGNSAESNATEEAIMKLLRRRVRPDFNNTPLRVVVETWAAELNIPILVDTVALESAGGATAEDPVTLSVIPEISFQSALRLVLDPKDLTYVIEDEVMKITTKDQGSARIRRMYDLAHFLTSNERIGELIGLIYNTVSANWDIDGGEDVIAAFGPVLVVYCPIEVQNDIECLLFELSKMSTENF